MQVFDGNLLAKQREALLKEKIVDAGFAGKLKIAAVLFVEDVGSRVYTRLKKEAAERVGIAYETHQFSLKDDLREVIAQIQELSEDESVTGIIIQKPWRRTWQKNQPNPELSPSDQRQKYAQWWGRLAREISQQKDVDGLHPVTIAQIKSATWQENNKVLPATCRAVLTILDRAGELENFSDKKTIIIGKSDLLGIPLYFELLRRNSEANCLPNEMGQGEPEGAVCIPDPNKKPREVVMIASKELEERMKSGQKLLDATILISATGRNNLVTGEMVSTGLVAIDVGEPKPDIDFQSVAPKSIFITPVPGGVGPLTVVSLLENCFDLASK